MKIILPEQLKKCTNGAIEIEIGAIDIKDLLSKLIEQHPALKERIYKADGKLNRFINIYVNDEDIRFLQNENTILKENDEVLILPSLAGG